MVPPDDSSVPDSLARCGSVKSRNNVHTRCPSRALSKGGLCRKHSGQKLVLRWQEGTLDPAESDNDTDPVSLEQFLETDPATGQKTVLVPGVHLFSYRTTVGDKVFQRTLLVDSLKKVVDHRCVDPFSNLPFSEEFMASARECILQRQRITSKRMRIILSLLDQFALLSFTVDPAWVEKLSARELRVWRQETHSLTARTGGTLPASRPPGSWNGLLQELLDVSLRNGLGAMVVLSSLAVVSRPTREAYPDLLRAFF